MERVEGVEVVEGLVGGEGSERVARREGVERVERPDAAAGGGGGGGRRRRLPQWMVPRLRQVLPRQHKALAARQRHRVGFPHRRAHEERGGAEPRLVVFGGDGAERPRLGGEQGAAWHEAVGLARSGEAEVHLALGDKEELVAAVARTVDALGGQQLTWCEECGDGAQRGHAEEAEGAHRQQLPVRARADELAVEGRCDAEAAGGELFAQQHLVKGVGVRGDGRRATGEG